MNRKVIGIPLALIGVFVIALIIWAAKNRTDKDTGANGAPVSLPPVSTSTPSATSTPHNNITVTVPQAGSEIRSPLTIKGQARVFENTLQYELMDADGVVLGSGYMTANSPDVGEFGAYAATFSYKKPATPTGILRVFNYSARDGSRENTVTVPVRFAQQQFSEEQTTTVNIFFSNAKRDPNNLFCDRTYPVMRTVTSTPRIGQTAIEKLLDGPTKEEIRQGYRTNIPSGAILQSLAIENGIAKVDFNDKLNKNVSGSCRVLAIRSEIENTLLQFPTVQKVVISVNGQSAEILEP